MTLLVNIDNGGTFTDVCVSDGTRVVHAKVPTTPHDLTQCFVHALGRASADLYGEEDVGRLLRDTDYLRYSTTSGTNAVVERKGTPVALLVEAGEEDLVYGATARLRDRGLWQSMVPARPSGLLVGAGNHIDEQDLIRIVNDMLAAGAQRLVVALRTAEAESRLKDILLDRYPRHLLGAIPFLLSWELAPDAEHARRTVSAVLNSYLHPGMEHFLYGAENICKQQHLRRPLLIYRNDGDSARIAKTTAIKTWGSGPRGGVEGTIAYARLYGAGMLVGMDIGGTTTDVTVVQDVTARLLAYGMMGGLETSFPLPDMGSFGLGGSSVIRVTDGAIVIGPESVGAAPGPACFGRGGDEATLTDALLLAGVLDARRYLGGELQLDHARATEAIRARVAGPLGVAVGPAVTRIINAFEQQAGALIAAAAGGTAMDGATLLAFGGGGPMIVCGIAEAAGIRRVIVPRLASVFSAFGIGFSNIAHAYQLSVQQDSSTDVGTVHAQLQERARRDMYGEGVDPAQCSQVFALWGALDGVVAETPIKNGKLPNVPGIVDPRLSLSCVYSLPVFALEEDDGTSRGPVPASGAIEIRIDEIAARVPVIDDAGLQPGLSATGPALVRGNYLTCYLKRGWRLRVSRNNDYILEAAGI